MENVSRAMWSDLGLVEYERSMQLQQALKQKLIEGADGYVVFLEHPPTITLGYSLKGDEGRSWIRSSPADLDRAGVKVVQVDRGGKATYHGPGQMVCYLILSLKKLRLGVKRYMGKLQQAVMAALTELGAPARLDRSYPGVWANGAKLAAVGVRVEQRITSHGFAINVDPDLELFAHIVPCGISDRPVTSLAQMGVEIPNRERLIALLRDRLQAEFRLELIPDSGEIEEIARGLE